MNDYIDIYAKQFNLTTRATSTTLMLFDDHNLVSYIKNEEPKMFYYFSKDGWSACKTSDIALLILNNTTAHG